VKTEPEKEKKRPPAPIYDKVVLRDDCPLFAPPPPSNRKPKRGRKKRKKKNRTREKRFSRRKLPPIRSMGEPY
jgi:hypothetical protein